MVNGEVEVQIGGRAWLEVAVCRSHIPWEVVDVSLRRGERALMKEKLTLHIVQYRSRIDGVVSLHRLGS